MFSYWCVWYLLLWRCDGAGLVIQGASLAWEMFSMLRLSNVTCWSTVCNSRQSFVLLRLPWQQLRSTLRPVWSYIPCRSVSLSAVMYETPGLTPTRNSGPPALCRKTVFGGGNHFSVTGWILVLCQWIISTLSPQLTFDKHKITSYKDLNCLLRPKFGRNKQYRRETHE